MYIVISISVIALFLTFLESKGRMHNGMIWGFVLVTLIGAIHYNYGNDYMDYYNLAQTIYATPFNLKTLIITEVFRDKGWVLLNYVFKPIGGFFTLVAVLNVLQNYIVYRIIKREVPQKWWVLAVFIYLFNTSLYLMSFTMMRQELVMIVFLGIWPWIKQRKFLLAVLALYMCSLIHMSAIVLVPFAFWGFLPTGNQRIMSAVFIVVLILLWYNQSYLTSIIDDASNVEQLSSYFKKYGKETETAIVRISLGFIISSLPLILCIIYLFSKNKRDENYVGVVWITLVGALFAPFALSLSMITRVSMYFNIYSIVAYPQVYGSVKNDIIRTAVIICFIFTTLYGYVAFFNYHVWIEGFSTYHTILEAL